MEQVNGQCLCGLVKVKFQVKEKVFDVCHCSMCRKWGGGPAFTVDAQDQVQFTGEEHIQTFDSSEWAQRGFCRHCGTHLFYQLKQTGFRNLPLGLLENSAEFKFHLQIFVDHKPASYEFANKTEMLTEAEVFAKYVP